MPDAKRVKLSADSPQSSADEEETGRDPGKAE